MEKTQFKKFLYGRDHGKKVEKLCSRVLRISENLKQKRGIAWSV